jgi:hypothetical protein
MEHSPSWEADSHSAGQILSLLWNPNLYYRVNNSLPLMSIVRQINPVHTFHPVFLRSFLILPSHPSLDFPSGIFLPLSPTKIFYGFLISPMRDTWPAHFILLNFITLIMFCETYMLGNSSLRSPLQTSSTTSLSNSNIFLSTLFKNTLSLHSSPSLRY